MLQIFKSCWGYAPKFSKILAIFAVFGVLYHYCCTNVGKIWHGWVDWSPLFHATFHPHWCSVSPCGAKDLKITLWVT